MSAIRAIYISGNRLSRKRHGCSFSAFNVVSESIEIGHLFNSSLLVPLIPNKLPDFKIFNGGGFYSIPFFSDSYEGFIHLGFPPQIYYHWVKQPRFLRKSSGLGVDFGCLFLRKKVFGESDVSIICSLISSSTFKFAPLQRRFVLTIALAFLQAAPQLNYFPPESQ